MVDYRGFNRDTPLRKRLTRGLVAMLVPEPTSRTLLMAAVWRLRVLVDSSLARPFWRKETIRGIFASVGVTPLHGAQEENSLQVVMYARLLDSLREASKMLVT